MYHEPNVKCTLCELPFYRSRYSLATRCSRCGNGIPYDEYVEHVRDTAANARKELKKNQALAKLLRKKTNV